MTGFEERQGSVRDLLDSAEELARGWENQEVATSLQWAAQRLEDDRFYVVVCGEFKRGKSSLVNALLNDPELLPVDIDIATRTVTVVTYAPKERIAVYLEDSDEPKSIGRDDIRRYATEGTGDRARPKVLTIETPSERLRSGVALVDTPGVGGLNEAHSAATFTFIPNADAVLLVADAIQPLTSSELEFARRAAEVAALFWIVVTKSDLVDDVETMVAGTRRKLSSTLRLPEDQITVLPVSSRLRLRYLQSHDPADLAESDFAALEQLVFEQLPARRGSASLVRTLHLLQGSLAALALPLQLERSLYNDQAAGEATTLSQQLEQAETGLDQLAREGAEWRDQLQRGMQAMSTQLEQRCRRGFDQLRATVEQDYLYDQRLLAEPAQISDRLQTEMMLLIGELGSDANRAAGRLLAELRAATNTEFQAAVAPLQIQVAGASERFARLKTATPLGSQQNGAILAEQGTGALIGGILGGFVGAATGYVLGGDKKSAKFGVAVSGWSRGRAIGAQIGRVAESILTTKRQFRELARTHGTELRRAVGPGAPDAETVRSEISGIAQPLIDQNESQTLTALGDTVTEFKQAIEQELDQRITSQRDALRRSRQAFEAGADRPTGQETDRKTKLDQELGQLEQINTAAAELERDLIEEREQ
jgi:GTP-binding protein EngB required for normal cell division